MKPLIAILTGLHVFAHGVFGCCDHGVVTPSRESNPCSCHHAVHHDVHAPSSERCAVADEEIPSQAPHQCFHASCHWLAGNVGPSISTLELSAPVSFVATLPSGHCAVPAAEFWPDFATSRSSAPPLRLHLVVGVLLI
jgi:hypothetical protein